MDWSASNIVTVALGKIIYLWNAGTGNIEELREYDNGDHACSLAWIQEGNIVAIGGNDGTVELWDCETKKRYVFSILSLPDSDAIDFNFENIKSFTVYE